MTSEGAQCNLVTKVFPACSSIDNINLLRKCENSLSNFNNFWFFSKLLTWWHRQYVGSLGSTGISSTWTSGAKRETATASDLGPSDSTLKKNKSLSNFQVSKYNMIRFHINNIKKYWCVVSFFGLVFPWIFWNDVRLPVFIVQKQETIFLYFIHDLTWILEVKFQGFAKVMSYLPFLSKTKFVSIGMQSRQSSDEVSSNKIYNLLTHTFSFSLQTQKYLVFSFLLLCSFHLTQ